MKTPKAFKIISLVIVSGLLISGFSSCNSKSAKKESPQISEKTIEKEVKEYIYPLPSTFEVTNMLNEIEASYIVGISNDPDKASTYFTEKSKAINLGIYTADLAYATTYNQKSDIQNYFKASETLVRELDLTGAFSEDLPDQIEANMDNKEKLVQIVSDMFQNAYAFLNKQGRTEVSYLVLTGTVYEALYLTTHISENTFQNPKLIETILFQKEPLLKLGEMLEEYKDSEMLKETYEDLAKVNAIYALEEGTTSMTKEQIEKLTETITQIRDKNVK
ncbi:hypothetical protein ACUNWD_09055 [Sunxiuqinia sp. A32]|uniref:hypothetical protein n=1 Tax=Sunxiuqinia sp. A32 TaxID=3461496 RepID=UPI004045FC21